MMNPNNASETREQGPTSTPAFDRSISRNGNSTQSDHSTLPAVKDVYRAINAVTKRVSRAGIGKDRKNQQQGYSFRGIDDIYDVLSRIIAEEDLCILPKYSEREQTERISSNDKALFYVTIRGDFDLVSVRDGSVHTVTMYGEAMDSADKATNKAMSAAYKYACIEAFCIPIKGNPDADERTPVVRAGHPAFDDIDTGGHPVGTQQAANHVRDRKLADTPPPKPPASETARHCPWRNAKERSQAFAQIRERVGEVRYGQVLSLFDDPDKGIQIQHAHQFRSNNTALDCYYKLMVIAQDEVA